MQKGDIKCRKAADCGLAIYLQHMLRHEYNLLTGWAAYADSKRI